MDDEDRKEFLEIIKRFGFTEDEFEISETIDPIPPAVVSVLSGTRTIKHKKTGISKTYEIYGKPPTWSTQIEDDFTSGLFKII